MRSAKTKTFYRKMDRLPKTFYDQAHAAGYKALVALVFGPFKLSNPSAVTGFKTTKRAAKYAGELQAEFPKARIEVLEVSHG